MKDSAALARSNMALERLQANLRTCTKSDELIQNQAIDPRKHAAYADCRSYPSLKLLDPPLPFSGPDGSVALEADVGQQSRRPQTAHACSSHRSTTASSSAVTPTATLSSAVATRMSRILCTGQRRLDHLSSLRGKVTGSLDRGSKLPTSRLRLGVG